MPLSGDRVQRALADRLISVMLCKGPSQQNHTVWRWARRLALGSATSSSAVAWGEDRNARCLAGSSASAATTPVHATTDSSGFSPHTAWTPLVLTLTRNQATQLLQPMLSIHLLHCAAARERGKVHSKKGREGGDTKGIGGG